jgi:hypothetical protein
MARDRILRISSRRPLADGRGNARYEDDQEHDRDEDGEFGLVAVGGAAGCGGDRRDGQRRDGKNQERGYQSRLVGTEPLRAVPEAAEQEGEPQHQEGVGQDRADECRAHNVEQARAQGEDADEELGQVAEGGLEGARRPGPQPHTKLPCSLADHSGKAGQAHRRRGEDGDASGAHEQQRQRGKARADGH